MCIRHQGAGGQYQNFIYFNEIQKTLEYVHCPSEQKEF